MTSFSFSEVRRRSGAVMLGMETFFLGGILVPPAVAVEATEVMETSEPQKGRGGEGGITVVARMLP